jgi:hypothetical protein
MLKFRTGCGKKIFVIFIELCIKGEDFLTIKGNNFWLSSFKGEDFLEIDQSETRIACGGHVC